MKNPLLLIFAALPFLSFALNTNTPERAAIVRAVEETTGWTADELVAGLERVGNLYKREMRTAAGRVRWHGEVVKVEYDTNTLTKTIIHTNGHRHVEHFTSVAAMGVPERLSAAERRRRAEERAKAAAAEKERRRLERIAYISTNFAGAVEAVMRAKRYPQDLAALLVKHELNTLVGTNTVTIVTGPAQ
jgi:hypothetical protein